MEEAAPAGRQNPGLGSRTLRNTALVLSARVLSRMLALVAVLAAANHLQPDGQGRFALVINSTALVAVVIDLGFNTLYVREGAREPEQIERYLNNLLSSKVILAVISLVILAGVLSVQGHGLIVYLLPAFLLMVLTSYSNLLRGTLYALQDLRWEAVAIVLESAVLLGLVAAGILLRQGVGFFVWAYAGQYGFSCAFFVVVLTLRRTVRLGWGFDFDLVRRWFWMSLPFALTFVITTIYFKIDVVILGFLRPASEVGDYSLAYKPFEALLFVPQAMLNVVFPVMARYHQVAPERLPLAVNRFFKGLVLIGWPLTVGVLVLTSGLSGLMHLFGRSEPALRILALAIVFMFISNAFIAALNAIDRQALFTWAAVVSMVVNVGLNVFLIPRYGYIGASWATVLTEVGLVAMGWYLVRRELAPVPIVRLSWRVLLAGAVMGLVLLPMHDVGGPAVLAVVAAGVVVYALAAKLLHVVDPDEIQFARSAVFRGGAAP